jgi:hypothetical protein
MRYVSSSISLDIDLPSLLRDNRHTATGRCWDPFPTMPPSRFLRKRWVEDAVPSTVWDAAGIRGWCTSSGSSCSSRCDSLNGSNRFNKFRRAPPTLDLLRKQHTSLSSDFDKLRRTRTLDLLRERDTSLSTNFHSFRRAPTLDPLRKRHTSLGSSFNSFR